MRYIGKDEETGFSLWASDEGADMVAIEIHDDRNNNVYRVRLDDGRFAAAARGHYPTRDDA